MPAVAFETPDRVGWTRTTGLAALSICSVVLLGAGCGISANSEGIRPLGPGTGGAPSTSSRSADRTGPSTSGSLGQLTPSELARGQAGEADDDIVGAWRSAERAFENAALHADPSEPELASTTVDPQLTATQSLLKGLRAADESAHGSVDLGRPMVVASTSTEATVRSCLWDAEIVISNRTGRPVPGVEGRAADESVISLMERTEGGWMLTDQEVREARCVAS